MSTRMNFEEAQSYVNNTCRDMFQDAAMRLQEDIAAVTDIVKEHPWLHLQTYLDNCYRQTIENAIPQIQEQLNETFDRGEYSFEAFAEDTINSDEATSFAKSIDAIVLSATQEYMSGLDSLLDELKSINVPDVDFDDEKVGPALDTLFNAGLKTLDNAQDTYARQIEAECDNNQFVAPLSAVPGILFGTLYAWYESISQSLPNFIDDACTFLGRKRSDATSYAQQIGNQSRNNAETIETTITLNK